MALLEANKLNMQEAAAASRVLMQQKEEETQSTVKDTSEKKDDTGVITEEPGRTNSPCLYNSALFI